MADCIFCKIIAGDIPAKKLHEDALCLGFYDLHPQAPVHALFIPKVHLANLNEASAEQAGLLGHLMWQAAAAAKRLGFADNGYRLVLNTLGHGGQTVHHLHLHLLGGRQLQWPPG